MRRFYRCLPLILFLLVSIRPVLAEEEFIPMGWCYPINNESGQDDWGFILQNHRVPYEQALMSASGATYIINLAMDMTDLKDTTQTTTEYYLTNPSTSSSLLKVFVGKYNGDSTALGRITGTYGDMHLMTSPEDFDSSNFKARTTFNDVFTALTKESANNPFFGGYYMGEEPIYYALYTPAELQDGYRNLNACFDDARNLRNSSSTQPIVIGSSSSCFVRTDTFPTVIADYGKMTATPASDFFRQVKGWDVYYDYYSPSLGNIVYCNEQEDKSSYMPIDYYERWLHIRDR